MKVSAKTKSKPTPVTVEVNVPEKLSELVSAFGEELIVSAARGAIVISAQATVRRHIEKGTSHADIQKAMNSWKPDVRSTVRVSAFEKTVSALDKLTPEERKELLSKITHLQAGQASTIKKAA